MIKSFIFLTLLLSIVDARVIRKTLVITRELVSSDCYEQYAFLVNGQLPGPPIYARVGDKMEITVRNNIPNAAFSMHWHGILHPTTPWADGVPSVTEFAILPGRERVYSFTVRRPGTYFYHSHTRFHAVTAHGALIVIDEQEQYDLGYDREHALIFTEYYRQQVDEYLDEHERFIDGKSIGSGDSLLVNGRTPAPFGVNQPCDNAPVNGTKCYSDRCSMYKLYVRKGETIRLRLINAGMKSALRFNIPKHDARIVEFDAHLVKPNQRIEEMDLHIAQRYSVLLKADQEIGAYDVTVGIEGVPSKKTAFRIVYVDTPMPDRQRPFSNTTLANFTVVDESKQVWEPFYESSHETKADRTILLNVTFEDKHFAVNGKVLQTPTLPHSLIEMAYKNASSVFDLQNIYPVKLGEVVDVVVQLGNFCSNHPWHMHGHFFWDMGGGVGAYDPATFKPYTNPIMKDTVILRRGEQKGTEICGYRVLRVKVENAGLWHMHCHIHDHMVRGMQIILAASLDKLPPIPPKLKHLVLDPPSIEAFEGLDFF